MRFRNKLKTLKTLYKKKDPYLIQKIIRNSYEYFILKSIHKLKRHKGIDLIKEDWDYLIILDACRFDTFSKIYDEILDSDQGKLSSKISAATSTTGWVKKNFVGRDTDIIYVTSNPIYRRFGNEKMKKSFYKIDDVWKYGWSEEHGTVLPEEVNKSVIKCVKKYPNKRMIIHYMQPHGPYIGKTKISFPQEEYTERNWTFMKIMDKVIYEKSIDIDEVKKAYEDNLRAVLKEIKKLLPKLKGKIVITADHGETFGEHGRYFHPEGLYYKELVTVPWFEVNND